MATSFPRGKKQAPLTAPPKVVAASSSAPSKKRKQPTGDDASDSNKATTVHNPVDEEDGVDALFGKKGLAQQQQKKTSGDDAAAKPKVRKQPKAADVKTQQKQDKDADVDAATVLTYKSLTRNLQLLGCVRQVNDSELLVSLPNKLIGVVALDQVSDEFFAYYVAKQQQSKKSKKPSASENGDDEPLPKLSEIFTVGQFVPCVVLTKGKENASKKISLSLRLSLLHSELTPQNVAKGMTLYGTVTSMEDHGAVVSVGVRGLTAFAPLKELQNARLSPRQGEQLLFTVTSINTHTSTLTLSPDAVKSVTRGDAFTLNQLSPGMLLNVRVEDVLTNGLRVTFLTFFSATVEQNHMSNPCEYGWEAAYRKGLKGRARIISVDKHTKQLTLSMAPHVVHLSAPQTQYVIGDVIEHAAIERVDAAIGMLLSLAKGTKKASAIGSQDVDEDMASDDDEEAEEDAEKKTGWQNFQPAYVHISNASDEHLDKLEKKFTVGDQVSCRVIGFAPFDGIVNVSCKASALAQLVLRHQDLTPGLKVKGTILAMEPWGIMLQLSEGVRGVVAATHVPPFVPLAKKKHIKKDAPSSHKFSVGKTVDARVLRVDAENKKTYLTMKKALVEGDGELVLSDFAKATPGVIAQGFITKIAEYGVVVSFYNNVYGLVPAALLHAAGIAKLEEAYVVGQVVKACVTRCDLAKQRLMLTFDLTGKGVKASSSSKSTAVDAASQELVGQTVTDVKVVSVDSTALRVQTADGLAGVLPFVQLTDFPRDTALVDALVQRWETGSVISDTLVVLSVDKKDGLVLSCKPLLVAHAQSVPRSVANVKERQLVMGFVASVSPSRGVFVRFLNQLTALAPKGLLSAKFVNEVADGAFEIGETVVCSVEKVDNEKQQFVVGFRDYALLAQGIGSGRDAFVEAQLKAWGSVVENASKLAKLGSVVDAEFLGVRPYGAVFSMDGETTVIVAGVDDAAWDEGVTVSLALVNYDWEKRVFFGSVDAALVGDKKSKKNKKKATKATVRVAKGTKVVDATIVAVQTTYAVVAFATETSEHRQLGVLQITDYWCPSRTVASLEVELGATISGVVHTSSISSTATPFDGLPLLVYQDEELLASSKKTSGSKKKKDKDAEPLPKYQSEDLQLGQLVTGRIEGIKEHALELKLKTSGKSKVVASVSVVDVDVTGADGVHPFDQFDVNMVVQGRVLSVVEKGANQRKPVSETNPANFHALSVSLRKQDVADFKGEVATLVRADWQKGSAGRALLAQGKQVDGVVVEQEANGLLVRLSHRVVAFVNATELSTDLTVLKDVRSHFPVGKRVRGYVVKVDENKKHVDLSLVRKTTDAKLKAGDVVLGMVTTKIPALKAPAVMVQLGVHTFGRADVTELKPPSQWTNAMQNQFAHGQFVQCVVLSASDAHIDLSLRADALASPKSYVKQTPPSFTVGSLVTAVVASTSSSGCFLRVDRATLARALLRDLSDEFIKDPVAEFPAGKLVVGRVTKATPKGLEVSLKASVVSDDVAMVKFSDLQVGTTVKGTITKVQTYGVFVKIDKSNISGLCHISEVADERVTQALDQIFSPGDYVKAKILKIDDLRVSFGLKPSYFEGEPESSEEEEEEEEEDEEDEEDEAMEVDEEADTSDEEEEEEPVSSKKASKQAEPMAVDEEVPSDSETESDSETPKSVGFTWDGFANVLDANKGRGDSDSDSEDEEMDEKKKVQQAKHKAKKQTDEWIALREKALASQDERPQTADDFERLLAVNPQSSFLWIQYMAFHVSLTQVDLARDVAVRATSAVSFRDEKEKLNVWVASLNLEHDFGDDASFQRVFSNALKVNHPKRVYLQLVDIYARASEFLDTETTLQTMQKKFRKSKQTWLRTIQFYVAQGSSAKAAETLQRALKALAPHKHLAVILKYGQLMFEHGELEKARTIFEGVLANYPKRLDLWNVYLDKEIKFNGGDVAHVRALFERLLAMDFSAKKMKFLFKKYLTFEQNHGDDGSVAHVKQLAKDFVAQAASA